MRHFTDDTFTTAVASGTTLVTFYATWCGPCRALSPTLDELDAHYGSRVTIAKVDIDHNPRTKAAYEIKAVPTSIIFHDGVPVCSVRGRKPLDVFAAELDKVLGDPALP